MQAAFYVVVQILYSDHLLEILWLYFEAEVLFYYYHEVDIIKAIEVKGILEVSLGGDRIIVYFKKGYTKISRKIKDLGPEEEKKDERNIYLMIHFARHASSACLVW